MLSFLKNKHVIVAMFVAPVLAVIAWYIVDDIVAEKPHKAVSGGSYRLMAMSNCRYQSGRCTLKNGDIEVVLTAERIDDGSIELSLSSGLQIDGVLVSAVIEEQELEPVHMRRMDAAHWSATVGIGEGSILRLAMDIGGSLYYTETGIDFIDYETGYSRENFSR